MVTLSINIIADSFHEDDIYELRINDDIKVIDQFTRNISFSLKDNGLYRVYFEQKHGHQLPKYIGIPLMLLCLPLKGLFNILTFNSEHDWYKETTAFRLSGYVDIEVHEDSEMEWRVTWGYFDQKRGTFVEPVLETSPSCNQLLSNVCDNTEIRRKYNAFINNLASVSIWFYLLFGYLFGISVYNSNHFAMILTGLLLLSLSCIILGIILVSRRKMRRLLCYMEVLRDNHNV